MSSIRPHTPQEEQESFLDAECTDVLNQYLKLVQEDSQHFHQYIAPNGVLDWFGCTIRGSLKIQSHFRYKICTEYEHADFDKAEKCDPIERMPSHERTKVSSNETVDPRKSNKYNKVNGVASLKLFADSDIEEDDVSMVPMPDDNQPVTKEVDASISDEESDSEIESKAKRLKRSTSPFYYLRRWAAKGRSQMDDNFSSSDEDDEVNKSESQINPIYSSLHYFESIGVLRPHVQNELRGANYSSNNGYVGERLVRIKISYRKRIPSHELQIALIIYENLDRPLVKTRRRLTFDWTQESQATETEALEPNNVEGETEETEASEEQPALIRNADEEMVVATVESPTTEEIAAALESAAFTIVPFGTPTKQTKTPSTPKRQPRIRHTAPQLKRSNLLADPSASTSKRGAARCLRL